MIRNSLVTELLCLKWITCRLTYIFQNWEYKAKLRYKVKYYIMIRCCVCTYNDPIMINCCVCSYNALIQSSIHITAMLTTWGEGVWQRHLKFSYLILNYLPLSPTPPPPAMYQGYTYCLAVNILCYCVFSVTAYSWRWTHLRPLVPLCVLLQSCLQ